MVNNNHEFARTNIKGQIVIPKEFRDSLGLDSSSDLKVSILGNSIMITPVVGVLTASDDMSSYKNLLKITKGAWGQISNEEKQSVEANKLREDLDTKDLKKSW